MIFPMLFIPFTKLIWFFLSYNLLFHTFVLLSVFTYFTLHSLFLSLYLTDMTFAIPYLLLCTFTHSSISTCFFFFFFYSLVLSVYFTDMIFPILHILLGTFIYPFISFFFFITIRLFIFPIFLLNQYDFSSPIFTPLFIYYFIHFTQIYPCIHIIFSILYLFPCTLPIWYFPFCIYFLY